MQTLTLTINGLITDPNNWSESPPGSLVVADDVVIDKPSVAECRRGQGRYGLLLGTPDKFYSYQGTLLAHYDSSMAYDANGAGSFSVYSGAFDSPDGVVRPRSFEASENFYLTSSVGIKKLDSIDGTFTEAGAPPGLGGTYTLTNPGFMDNNVQVAYRIVWGRRDANDNEIVGAPSQRMVVINTTGSTADVVQTWDIPDDVTTDWFYRVYRSGFSAGGAFPPDDELGQIKEGNPTSGEITAGQFTFTDIVPNALRGATLYTSPSQEGILQANEQPPFALDICGFRNCAFYFNTRLKQRFFGTLVSVGDNTLGGSFGYQTNSGDTHTDTTIDGLTLAASLVVQDLTYTADAAGVAGNDISIEYTGGATAGSEVVTVTGNAISVQIETGVSTATQIETAVDGSAPASALISVAVTGTGSNPQVVAAQAFLEDGFDTTYLNVGMRVVGAGVVAGTTIVSIDSASAITVSVATTATATVALEFQDRFSINDMNYWAASTADYPNRQFIAYLAGTPGQNIEQTALNLIQAINKDPNNSLVYAYYTTNSGDLPGSFLIQERNIGGAFFYVTSTNGESFAPVLPLLTQTQISDNDARQNRVYFSKVQQPEAVPILNFLDVGSENFPIVRGLANRDSIFVFKEEEGIFRITGTDASTFIVSLFDSGTAIRVAESAVVLNNQIFAFTDQNVIAVSEGGVELISDPQIQSVLNEISSPLFPTFGAETFGVAYETDRSYILFTVENPEDMYATVAYRFNFITRSWSKWFMNASAGLVLPSNRKLYTGNPTNNYVYQERKNFNRTDYADEEFDVTIVSSDGLEIVLTDTTDLGEGDLIKQDDLEAIIVDVVDSTTIEVNLDQDWDAGSAQVYQKIAGKVKWIPNGAGNPGILKHFTEATFLFKDAPFYTAEAGFQTDLIDSTDRVPLSAASGQGWGEFPWGDRPWSVPGGRALTIRTYVPLESQRASWLNIEVENMEAFSNFSLSGVTVQFEPMSSKQR